MIFRASDALAEIAPFVDGGGVDVRCEPGRSQGFAVLNRAIRQLMNDRMYPLTLDGLDDAMRELSRKR